jgi:hypothetical protein
MRFHWTGRALVKSDEQVRSSCRGKRGRDAGDGETGSSATLAHLSWESELGW